MGIKIIERATKKSILQFGSLFCDNQELPESKFRKLFCSRILLLSNKEYQVSEYISIIVAKLRKFINLTSQMIDW